MKHLKHFKLFIKNKSSMDITKHQIKNGSTQELIAFRNEIAVYLGSKKYSSKSITLLSTMKNINIELTNRESLKKKRVILKRDYLDKDDEPGLLVYVPEFLQDNLLKIKRLRSDENTFISNFNNSFGCTPIGNIDSDTDSSLFSAFYIKQVDSDETECFSYSCSSTANLELKEDHAELFFC